MVKNARTIKGSQGTGESGAAFVEFTLTIPLLVVLVSAMVEFGNIASQLTMIAQSGYHLAVVAAESPRGAAAPLVQSRFEQVQELVASSPNRAQLELLSVSSPSYDDAAGVRSTTLMLDALIQPISSISFRLPIQIEVTAPQLLLNTADTSDYSTFAPPSPYFGCTVSSGQFQAVGGPSSAACLSTCTIQAGIPGSEECAPA